MGKKAKGALHISEVSRQSARLGRVGPVLAAWEHAPLDPSSLACADPKVALGLHAWRGDCPSLELRLSAGQIEYSTEGREATGPGSLATYLAIRDRETGKTRLVEANPLVLRPLVAAPPTRNPALLEPAAPAEQTFAQRMEASKHLIKAFGQQKGSRFYEQQERMRIEPGQVEERAAKAAAGAEQVSVEAVEGTTGLLPPRDPAARSPAEVYSLETMLPKGERAALAAAAGSLLVAGGLEELRKDRQLSGLGAGLLAAQLAAPAPDLALAGLVLYLEGVVRFTRLRPAELHKGPRSLQDFLPAALRQRIADTFSLVSGSDRVVTPGLADRAKCHVIVLALLAHNLSVEVAQLTDALFVRPDHLRKLVSVVGARLEGEGSAGQRVVLRLPLASFAMEMHRARKGKR